MALMRIPKLNCCWWCCSAAQLWPVGSVCTRCRSRTFSPVPAATSKTLPSSTTTIALRFVLEPDGRLAITEVISVEFTTYGKHGIYRIFDTGDAQYANIEHPVEVVSVERRQGGDWVPEPYIVSQEGGGTKTIRVGSQGRTFDRGIQRYRIISTTETR